MYEIDLNPSGSLDDSDLEKGIHEKLVLLRRLNVTTGSYEIVGQIDLGSIGRVIGFVEDWSHERLFIREYGARLYYRYWVLEAKKLKVVTKLDVESQEPQMPLVVSPDGSRIWISWKSGDVAQGRSAWLTSVVDAVNYKTIRTLTEFTVRTSSFGRESSEFSEDGKWLYTYRLSRNPTIIDEADTLIVVDASTDEILNVIPYSTITLGNLTIRGIRNGKLIGTQELQRDADTQPGVFGLVYDLSARKLISRVSLADFSEGWSFVDGTGKRLVINVWKETPDGQLIPAGSLNVFDMEKGLASKVAVRGRVLLSLEQNEVVYVAVDHELAKIDVGTASVIEHFPLSRQTQGVKRSR